MDFQWKWVYLHQKCATPLPSSLLGPPSGGVVDSSEPKKSEADYTIIVLSPPSLLKSSFDVDVASSEPPLPLPSSKFSPIEGESSLASSLLSLSPPSPASALSPFAPTSPLSSLSPPPSPHHRHYLLHHRHYLLHHRHFSTIIVSSTTIISSTIIICAVSFLAIIFDI